MVSNSENTTLEQQSKKKLKSQENESISLEQLFSNQSLVTHNEFNYQQPVTYGRFVTAVDSKGRNLFIPRRSEATKKFDSSIQKNNIASRRGLLSQSIHSILDKIEKEVPNEKNQAVTIQSKTPEKTIDTTLWVDKYRPKNYLDLVGDQRLFREALEWVKHWEHCVFLDKKDPGKNFKQQNLDPFYRPEKKIMLLCGPPGLGKTSLAHILANHSGYNCVEINASDDRTASVVRERITNAIEMKSMFGNQRPNLIIIDEIDGVSTAGGNQNFINLLIQLATAGSELATSKKEHRKKKTKVLKRPIICICNDQFAPALRQLRPLCQIFSFKRLGSGYLVKHLQEICSNEDVTIDNHTLSALCEITQGDLRSSINSLQFLSESHGRNIGYETLIEGQAGSKDMPKSLFSIWDQLFQLPPSRLSISRKRDLEGKLLSPKNSYAEELSSIICTHGGFNIIMEGCFENYLHTKYIDTYMDKVCKAGEWLMWHDELDVRINSKQQLGLYAYFPHPIVAFHNLFATASVKKIEYPKLGRQCRENLRTNENLLSGFFESFSPSVRRTIPKSSLVLYFIHFALQIVEPELGQLNPQVLSASERKRIERVVSRMISLNLQYIQTRTPEGQVVYELDPPIPSLTKYTYNNSNMDFFSHGRNEVKQMILNEIEKTVVRNSFQAKLALEPSQPAKAAFETSNLQFQPTPLAVEIKKSTILDPFSKFRDSSMPQPNLSRHGYSNAVRTPFYMDEL